MLINRRAIVGRTGRLENAHDLEGIVLVAIPFVGQAMGWLELVADLQAGLLGHGRADHGFEEMVRLEVTAARLELVFLPARIFQFVKQLRDGSHDAKAFVIVA